MNIKLPHLMGPEETAAIMHFIKLGLEEDLGQAGDMTSQALVPATLQGTARFVARKPGILAGLEAARTVLVDLVADGESSSWEPHCSDGTRLEPGQVIAHVSGCLLVLLARERLALNFIQRLSGVATLTRRYVDAIAGLPCRIYDTRKTTPGWRVLEKYAVRVGGGFNHRLGLYDAVLIKDNHVVAWRSQPGRGSLADAVRAARAAVPARTVVELEVDSIAELDEALAGEPDIVLLDNMSLDQLRQAVAIRNRLLPRLMLEASGGITLEAVRKVAETGVDRISIGALTHSAPALDIALDFEQPALAAGFGRSPEVFPEVRNG